MNNLVLIALQLLVVVGTLVLLNFIALKIMEKEEIIDEPVGRKASIIFKGWVETGSFVGRSFNSYNRFAKNYRKLPASVNTKGGAQFSYSFWIKINNTAPNNVANKVIMVRGDPSRYEYNKTEYGVNKSENDVVIKCPLIKFGNSVEEIIVEYNTTHDVMTQSVVSRLKSSDETIRRNVLSLIPGKWALFTFTFEDDKRYSEFEDGVVFRFYINDILYHTERTRGALKLNGGHLSLFPAGGVGDGYMSDLTYWNFALNIEDVRKVFSKGFNNIRFNDLDSDASFNEPLYLSQYNKLEIYNA
jgi:hypothetical protein